MQGSSASSDVALLQLTPPALRAVDAVLDDLLASHDDPSDAACVAQASAHSARLPRELRAALARLTTGRREPSLLIRGVGVDDRAIGPTPSHWTACHPFSTDSPTRREEFLLALVAQSVGEIFGYASLQEGRLVHNVMPIAGAESDQSGHGSKAILEWHTEDAFTPFRADYLALLGLRNRDAVATTLAGIGALDELDASDCRILAEERYAIAPDEEHLRSPLPRGDASILSERAGAKLIPVLSRTSRGPQMVMDSVYMSPVDQAAAASFRRATQAIDAALRPVPLLPGDILIVDNHRAVHGRERFPARFDGTDRWLLKASIACNLEPSAPHRAGPGSRILQ